MFSLMNDIRKFKICDLHKLIYIIHYYIGVLFINISTYELCCPRLVTGVNIQLNLVFWNNIQKNGPHVQSITLFWATINGSG